MAGFFGKQPSSRVLLNQALQYTNANTSVPSTNFSAQTYQIRVISQLAGYLAFGPGSTYGTTLAAVVQSSSLLLPASTVGGEYFAVSPGMMCAFISSSTSSGTCNVTEMT
jgi:hypothetical protein